MALLSVLSDDWQAKQQQTTRSVKYFMGGLLPKIDKILHLRFVALNFPSARRHPTHQENTPQSTQHG